MKVGICGLGDRLSYVAKVMHELIPNFDLVAYADPESVKVEYMQSHGISMRAYDELADMLQNEQLDMLMIGSPNHMHLEHLRLGIEAGLLIFAEKPIVMSEQQTYDVLELIAKHNAFDKILVGMVLRYAPLYKDLVAALSSKLLGEITSIEASEHIPPEHGAFFMRDWRRHQGLSGGFLLEKCCHDLDLYQGIVNSRPAKLASFGGRRTFTPENKHLGKHPVYHQRKSRWNGIDEVFDNDSELVDHQTALIQYENGINLSFHTNLNVPNDYRHFSVFGTLGMAEGDFVRNYFKVHDCITSGALIDKTYLHDDSISMHYGAEEEMAADWIAFFERGTPLPVSIVDALQAGLTAIKLDEARQTGSIIDMTETWKKFDSYLNKN
ncbi:Gfo/Idh/MocA family oxidoreductase [Pseudoalteromonas profundi]|uniref:Gfo/Idh/MocA family oxidoreductase n=1 Tax=Pseudoalteromonas gelatinilytica TaxID=1703256 RepID=A0A3A3EQL2_9GAMM|nr:Gfo/Idh/MocA family oxidoreductase [Pseudoalteromonas profundi]RJF37507.1 gfo/Idh/MocA family oxidoreductase [Pseudoalteromonas profundi]